MKTVTISGKKVEIYDSIDELPISRFHRYNKMLLIDSGIGSDLSDFDQHLEKAIRFCRTNNPELAERELDNLRQNVYFIQSNISPRHLAFCTLVKSVDGVQHGDMTDDGLKVLLDMLSDATHAELAAHTEAVKKKIDEELQLYFPRLFDNPEVKEYFDQLKHRTMVMIDSIVSGNTEGKRQEIDDMTTLLITYVKPSAYSGSNGMEVQYDKQFESMCLVISQKLHVDPKRMTVMEYYSAFEHVKELMKSNRS